jgi:hypothetical protein
VLVKKKGEHPFPPKISSTMLGDIGDGLKLAGLDVNKPLSVYVGTSVQDTVPTIAGIPLSSIYS